MVNGQRSRFKVRPRFCTFSQGDVRASFIFDLVRTIHALTILEVSLTIQSIKDNSRIRFNCNGYIITHC